MAEEAGMHPVDTLNERMGGAAPLPALMTSCRHRPGRAAGGPLVCGLVDRARFYRHYMAWHMKYLADSVARHDQRTPVHINRRALLIQPGRTIPSICRCWRCTVDHLGGSCHPTWHFTPGDAAAHRGGRRRDLRPPASCGGCPSRSGSPNSRAARTISAACGRSARPARRFNDGCGKGCSRGRRRLYSGCGTRGEMDSRPANGDWRTCWAARPSDRTPWGEWSMYFSSIRNSLPTRNRHRIAWPF